MKAVIPALFFATLAMPSGAIAATLLALLVFWVARESSDESQLTC